jgi:hypothetical protein
MLEHKTCFSLRPGHSRAIWRPSISLLWSSEMGVPSRAMWCLIEMNGADVRAGSVETHFIYGFQL